MFASLHDLYGASRSCHEVLDELIPKVLLSTLKHRITLNSKTDMHEQTVIPMGLVQTDQWIMYKSYANTEGKLMARLTELQRQHLPHA
jgi:hypothetical protein